MNERVETVHVSTLPRSSVVSRSFLPTYNDGSSNDEHTASLVSDIKSGKSPSPFAMPSRQIASRENASLLPAFTCGFVCVSQTIAEVMKRFDLGSGYLHQVPFFDQNGNQLGNYYILVFGNVKRSFSPTNSPKAKINPYDDGQWSPPYVVRDGDIAVDETALGGPDVWIDPGLLLTFFVSGRLAAALDQKGCKEPLMLTSCRVC